MRGTKISPFADARVAKICDKLGLSSYTITQMMYDTIIRYMDDRHNLTPEMEQAMAIFEHLSGWRDALNWADPTVQMEVGEAVYFMQDALGKKKGTRAVHVEKPFMGHWTQTENVQQILERVLCLLLPERYQRLRLLAVDMDCSSVLEMIDQLIDRHGSEAAIQAVRKEFEDANRSEYGRKPADAPYRRKHYRDMDIIFPDHESD